MIGSMAWLSVDGSDSEKILHLKVGNGDWAPYWEYPFARRYEQAGAIAQTTSDFDLSASINRSVPAMQLSKGWHVYQALLKQGWKLSPSSDAIAA